MLVCPRTSWKAAHGTSTLCSSLAELGNRLRCSCWSTCGLFKSLLVPTNPAASASPKPGRIFPGNTLTEGYFAEEAKHPLKTTQQVRTPCLSFPLCQGYIQQAGAFSPSPPCPTPYISGQQAAGCAGRVLSRCGFGFSAFPRGCFTSNMAPLLICCCPLFPHFSSFYFSC